MLKIEGRGTVKVLWSNTRINQSRPLKTCLIEMLKNLWFTRNLMKRWKLNLNWKMTDRPKNNRKLGTYKILTSQIYCSLTSFQNNSTKTLSTSFILSRHSMILFSFWDAFLILRNNGQNKSSKTTLISFTSLHGSDIPREDTKQTRIKKSASHLYASVTVEDQVTNVQICLEKETISSASHSANREFQFAKSNLAMTSG